MSEETTPKQTADAPSAATNSGGYDAGAKKNYRSDKDAGMGMERGGDRPFKGRRRRKVSYLTINKIDTVDYKEINILRRFINEHGKILPSRQTGCTAKQQRMISRAIRRAREMALLPFVVTEITADRPMRPRAPREGGYNRDRDYRDNREPREPRAAEGGE